VPTKKATAKSAPKAPGSEHMLICGFRRNTGHLLITLQRKLAAGSQVHFLCESTLEERLAEFDDDGVIYTAPEQHQLKMGEGMLSPECVTLRAPASIRLLHYITTLLELTLPRFSQILLHPDLLPPQLPGPARAPLRGRPRRAAHVPRRVPLAPDEGLQGRAHPVGHEVRRAVAQVDLSAASHLSLPLAGTRTTPSTATRTSSDVSCSSERFKRSSG
jgi:hypothetical protein